MLSQLGWFNCQEMGKWNYVRVISWPWGRVKFPKGCKQSSQRASGVVYLYTLMAAETVWVEG